MSALAGAAIGDYPPLFVVEAEDELELQALAGRVQRSRLSTTERPRLATVERNRITEAQERDGVA